MARKINGKWMGESPKEQVKIEKRKFENRSLKKKNNSVNLKTGQTYLFKKDL